MQKKLFCALFFSLLSFSSAYAAELENLDTLKTQLVRYHDSGQYANDIAVVGANALTYLKQRVARAKPSEKLAIIVDIDETALSNYRDIAIMGFGGTLKQIMDEENKGTDEAIAPTLALYQFAKANHIAVFFVTGRTQNYRAATERNLTDAGFKNFDGLTMKPEDYREPSVVPYKSHARKAVADQGYTIVLNIGDQASDLAGGYAEKTFKVPNPYYYIN
jgi:predicted secreted acid phosphatase